MLDEKQIIEQLGKTNCYKCGANMGQARYTPLGKVATAAVVHTKCQSCEAESIITLTLGGQGVIPFISDLKVTEMAKFVLNKPTSYDDLFAIHKILKKGTLWKLLQRSEPLSENKTKN